MSFLGQKLSKFFFFHIFNNSKNPQLFLLFYFHIKPKIFYLLGNNSHFIFEIFLFNIFDD